jgi:hypothetical protein
MFEKCKPVKNTHIRQCNKQIKNYQQQPPTMLYNSSIWQPWGQIRIQAAINTHREQKEQAQSELPAATGNQTRDSFINDRHELKQKRKRTDENIIQETGRIMGLS